MHIDDPEEPLRPNSIHSLKTEHFLDPRRLIHEHRPQRNKNKRQSILNPFPHRFLLLNQRSLKIPRHNNPLRGFPTNPHSERNYWVQFYTLCLFDLESFRYGGQS